MKILNTTVLLLALTAAAALAAPGGDWFDLENCAMCKNLTADQELFDSMVWTNHLFANGVVEITTVPAAYEERFQALMAKMEAMGAEMQSGKQMYMCGMCQSYGGLMMAGASMDYITNGEDHISVISSRDPDVVKQIRTHGQRTIDEFAKWMAAEGETGHDHAQGHDHHH
ncbi:hypothetical protein H8E07_03525 [bacterium]|nr:hypothetical protein [bacterium]